MRTMRVRGALLACGLTGLILSGCGGGSDSEEEAGQPSSDEGGAATTAAGAANHSMTPGAVKVKHPCDVVTAAEVAAIMGNGTYQQSRAPGTDASLQNGLTCTYKLDVPSGKPFSTVHLRVFTAGTNNALAGGNAVFKDSADEIRKTPSGYELVDYPGASLAYFFKAATNANSRELSIRFGDALGVKSYVGVGSGMDLASVEGNVRPLADLLVQRVRA